MAEEARARLRPFGIYFEATLNDLIRGIRSCKDASARQTLLKKALSDCRNEVRQPDMQLKTMAILKLVYLEMYGYDMSWAAFHVLEVMSSSKFQQKRVGYLAGMQAFKADDDVLMLTTNLLKKDLSTSRDVPMALSGIACFVTPSLSVDVADDVIKMLSNSRPYVRKKAVLALYKIFLQYPEALRTALPRLTEKLNDDDPSVVSAAVNVICELAKQNPKMYVSYAPQLYELLTTSKNNWMLIKILKLFSSLVLAEQRLKPKVLPAIVNLMESTTAMSLQYECINSIVSGNLLDTDDYQLAQTCVDKLKGLLLESDQNLKFVALLAFSKIVKLHPHLIYECQDAIVDCIDDEDFTIRMRVIELVGGLANDDNIYSLVNKMAEQLKVEADKELRFLLLEKILEICCANNYSRIPDFEWYLDLLKTFITYTTDGNSLSNEIGLQLREIAVRVKAIRSEALAICTSIILDHDSPNLARQNELLATVTWVAGEYASESNDPYNALSALLSATNIDPKIVIPSCMKLYTVLCERLHDGKVLESVTEKVVNFLTTHNTAYDYEVQERAAEFLEFMKLVAESLSSMLESGEKPLLVTMILPSFFSGDLKTVSKNYQKKMRIPENIDLETPLNPDFESLISSDWIQNSIIYEPESPPAELFEAEESESSNSKHSKKNDHKDDPFYLSNSTPYSRSSSTLSSIHALETNDSLPAGNLSEKLSSTLKKQPKMKKKIEIAKDADYESETDKEVDTKKKKKSILGVNKSLLASYDLESDSPPSSITEVQPSTPETETVKTKKKSTKKKSSKAKSDGDVDGEKKKKKKRRAVIEN